MGIFRPLSSIFLIFFLWTAHDSSATTLPAGIDLEQVRLDSLARAVANLEVIYYRRAVRDALASELETPAAGQGLRLEQEQQQVRQQLGIALRSAGRFVEEIADGATLIAGISGYVPPELPQPITAQTLIDNLGVRNTWDQVHGVVTVLEPIMIGGGLLLNAGSGSSGFGRTLAIIGVSSSFVSSIMKATRGGERELMNRLRERVPLADTTIARYLPAGVQFDGASRLAYDDLRQRFELLQFYGGRAGELATTLSNLAAEGQNLQQRIAQASTLSPALEQEIHGYLNTLTFNVNQFQDLSIVSGQYVRSLGEELRSYEQKHLALAPVLSPVRVSLEQFQSTFQENVERTLRTQVPQFTNHLTRLQALQLVQG